MNHIGTLKIGILLIINSFVLSCENRTRFIEVKNDVEFASIENEIDFNPDTSIKKLSNKWIGEWIRQEWQNDAILKITEITSDSLDFIINASSGTHIGYLEGKASIENNTADFYWKDEYINCRIQFTLFKDSIISLDELHDFCGAGMGVYYSGDYVNSQYIEEESLKKEDLISLGIFTAEEDVVFKELVGNSYDDFVNYTEMVYEENDIDNLNSKVTSSSVKGLFTIMEYIIMIDANLNIWAAIIADDKIHYFTNRTDYSEKLPKTIDKWREGMNDKEIVYKSKS